MYYCIFSSIDAKG